jgi:hypothetical protein|tara:strand:+ start:346 stop:678 length:333 start_codon:yes stop_codon:yes gene_type:complete
MHPVYHLLTIWVVLLSRIINMKENLLMTMPVSALTYVVKLRKQYHDLENALAHMDAGNYAHGRLSISTGLGHPHTDWVEVTVHAPVQRELLLASMSEVKTEIQQYCEADV